MGRTGLRAAALLTPLALALALPLLWRPGPSERRPPVPLSGQHRPAAMTSAAVAAAGAAGGDPNLPLYVGNSRRLAARAIDDTAAAQHDAALLALGRRFLGFPARDVPPGSRPTERLVLDLTAVDALSYVEQLLALVNSRQVRTRTEAADRFSDHVRRLRYGGGRVDRCARLTHPRLWALAAARRGYLVDLTPFLPGARERRMWLQDLFQSRPSGPAPVSTGRQACLLPRLGAAAVTLAELPLQAVPAAATSLRSGDLFLLVHRAPDPQPAGIGLVDLEGGRLGGLMVRPGEGVVRVPDLIAMARRQPGTIGIAFLRTLPNADGLPDP